MRLKLLSSCFLMTLAMQPLHSHAHADAVAHVHEWTMLESLAVLGIASVVILLIRRNLKR